MKQIPDEINRQDIFFITPDVKRGLGLEDLLPNYHIVCSRFDPIIPVIRNQGGKIYCLEEERENLSANINNSGRIFELDEVQEYISENTKSSPWIMFFKPSAKMDYLTAKKGFRAIGNNHKLNEELENKINFSVVLNKYFPRYSIPNIINRLDRLDYREITQKLGENFVVQFGHGWAGSTTYFIGKLQDFLSLRSRFPETWVKVSKKIEGISLLNNCCISGDSLIISPPAIQISGIRLLSDKPGVTCGRQWPADNLTPEMIRVIRDISREFGRYLKSVGYKGIFGLDFLMDKKNGQIFLSEINARMTASTPFYSKLERKVSQFPILEYHLAAFMDLHEKQAGVSDEMVNIHGSQITFRKDYPGSLLDSLEDFGTYRIDGKKAELIHHDYLPQSLKDGEFIFSRIKRSLDCINGHEQSRMETKNQVLDSGKLNGWVEDILVTPDQKNNHQK